MVLEAVISTCTAGASSTSIMLLFLAAPSISLLYSVSVWFFLSVWKECPSWIDGEHIKCILIRAIMFAGSWIIGMNMNVVDITSGIVAGVSLLGIVGVSIYLLRETRIKQILGVEPAWVNMEGRVVLITGANSGIGRETARQLLQRGATIIMACRSEKRANEAMYDITKSIPQHKGKMIFLQMDLSSLQSVRDAVKAFLALNLPLHILINNAGVMMGYRTTVADNKNLELMMTANHLGHFLLTNLLMPHLQKTAEKDGDVRILNVTSSTYHLAGPFDFEDMMADGTNRTYALFNQYAMTKLANILTARQILHRQQQQQHQQSYQKASKTPIIQTYSIHPGLVRTEVTKNMSALLQTLNQIFAFFVAVHQKTPAAGAYTSVYCATTDSKELENGSYFVNSHVQKLNKYALDREAASKLWTVSEELVGLKDATTTK